MGAGSGGRTGSYEAAACIGAALALTATALRRRRRVTRMAVLPSGDGAVRVVGDESSVIAVDGLVVGDATVVAAARFAEEHGLDAVDLVPGDLPLERAMDLLRTTDPGRYRTAPTANPPGGCQAVVVSGALALRMGVKPEGGLDRGDLLVIGERLRKGGAGNVDLALAPHLVAGPDSAADDVRQLRAAHRDGAVGMLTARAVGAGLLALVAWRGLRAGRWSGLAPLAAYSAQGVIAFAGTPLAPRDRWRRSVLRLPCRLVDVVATTGAVLAGDRAERQACEEQRPVYDALLAGGTDGFFHDRRPDCPMCGSTDLHAHVRVGDLRLIKPGTFSLERCGGCRHIFQNPMLTGAGLAFHYRDAYDGLSERNMEVLFDAGRRLDRRRAERLAAHAKPARWLDIGAGHGHFCRAARQILPDTEFHGLDFTDGIDEAERRGWVDRAHRGEVGSFADELAGSFDAVSMHHYLEHAVDPRADLAAAASMLRPGGHLLVEVPNGHSPGARLCGSLWFHWVAPQHLHFLPEENLVAELEALGFEIVERQRHEAHLFGVDFVASLANVVNHVAPPAHWPWQPRRTTASRVARIAAIVACAPVMPIAVAADVVLLGVVRITGNGNAYGLIARLPGGDAADGVPVAPAAAS